MEMFLLGSVVSEAISYAGQIGILEFLGLLFGLLCVLLLIKENIWTWPAGIAYVLVSFYVFWTARLYGDFILHLIFLVLNIYGWYTWSQKNKDDEETLVITNLSWREVLTYVVVSLVGIVLFAKFLMALPQLFDGVDPPSLPYWDSTTSILSVTGIWLQARKKIDNWYYWFAVDVLATGVYYYKGIYFYSVLYFIYIFLAIAGYREWRKRMTLSS